MRDVSFISDGSAFEPVYRLTAAAPRPSVPAMSDSAVPTDSATSPPAASFTRAGVWHGMKLTLPYSISALPFGLAFGAAAVAAGMTPGAAVLMSALAFAGSAQFAVLSL